VIGEITLEPLTDDTLEFVRQVRSDPEVYYWLFAHKAEISKDTQQAWWRAQDKPSPYYVARCDGVPFGYAKMCRYKTLSGACLGICVASDFQGKGLGEGLLRAAIALGRISGVRWFWLLVYSDNERAINLYRKCGFEKLSGTVPVYVSSDVSRPVQVMVRVE